MTFAVTIWCGLDVATNLCGQKPNLVCVELFSKLGGQHLGQVHVDKTKTLVELVRDLQRQASKLLVHSRRPSSYLVVFVDGLTLPSFTYDTQLDKELEHEALDSLIKVTTESRLECMYDEDDTQAFVKLKQAHNWFFRQAGHGVHWFGESSDACHSVVVEDNLLGEIAVLNYTKQHLALVIHGQSAEKLDCSVLSGLTNLTCLDVRRKVKDWVFARHLDLKELFVVLRGLHEVDFDCLPHLEKLTVDAGPEKLDYNLAEKLPKNVRTTIRTYSSLLVPDFWRNFPNIAWEFMQHGCITTLCTLELPAP
jgi:hypothetical protein